MMSSTTTTIVKATSTAIAILIVGISVYIPYAKYRWEYRLKSFIENHKNDCNLKQQSYTNGKEDNDNILLIVNPASGGGKSMELYPTILEELKRRTSSNSNSNVIGQGSSSYNNVHVFITQSSNDMINFTRQTKTNHDEYYHHISKYKIIAIMGGDSSITEFVQYELQQNNGKWPFAPILHLPTGTGNAISTECFGKISIQNIIKHGLTKSKLASVIKITTTSPTTGHQEEPKYALHNCFDGIQRYMIDNLDKCRKHLYPAFGKMIVMPIVISSLFMFNDVQQQKSSIPYILAIITDTEGMDMKLNFGLSRFSSDSSSSNTESKPKKMMMIIKAKRWPGPIQFLMLFQKFMSGELGNDYINGRKLPDWLYMEKTNQFTLNNEDANSSPSSSSPSTASGDGDGDDNENNNNNNNNNNQNNNNNNNFNMYLDGGGTIPCKGSLPITFEVIPNSIPYFVHDGMY